MDAAYYTMSAAFQEALCASQHCACARLDLQCIGTSVFIWLSRAVTQVVMNLLGFFFSNPPAKEDLDV